LPGMLTTDIETCDRFTTCLANSNLGMTLGNTPVDVVDPELCNLVIPEETELFTCPLDTPMAGAVVTDLLLCQAPNDENKCSMGTDLEGVYVMDTASDCTIFTECNAGSPLGMTLGDQTVEVADPTLCNLDVPEEVELFLCIEGPMEGAVVTDDDLCQAPNDNNKCPQNTDLAGVFVMNTDTDCDIYETCPVNTLQEGIQVSDLELCDVADGIICGAGTVNEGQVVTSQFLCDLQNQEISGQECPEGTDLEGVFVANPDEDCNIFEICPPDTLNAATTVTNLILCEVPNDNNICGENTDLPGVFVNNTTQDCDIFEICPQGTELEGAVVTDLVLCGTIELTQTIAVNKTTSCDPDRVGQEVCDNIPDSTIMALGNNTNPSFFLESQTPLNVTLDEGPYSIMEKDMTTGFNRCSEIALQFDAGRDLPQFGPDVFICSNLSEDCMGTAVGGGSPLTCDMANVVFPRIQDLAVANQMDDDVSILLGNGDGTFVTPATDFQVGRDPVSVAVGLFDADSNLDLAVVNQFDDDVSILLGNGDGTFVTPATDFQVGEEPVSVAVGNFN
ncbi:MAG: hypothetical protein ACPKPY_12670, partial [Nitrososphaeraceae archaeon]